MKTYELSALVKAEDARDLLLELADDPRVRAVTVKTGEGKYLVPDPGPGGSDGDS